MAAAQVAARATVQTAAVIFLKAFAFINNQILPIGRLLNSEQAEESKDDLVDKYAEDLAEEVELDDVAVHSLFCEKENL